MLSRISTTGFTPSRNLSYGYVRPEGTFLSGASSDMKEPPLRTSCGGGSFVLRSAPERKVTLGPALPRRCRYGQYRSELKMARGLLGRACVFASRHVGVMATCIFASILQSKAPAYRPRAKNRDFSMFSTDDGRGYGLTAFDLQGYSRSLAFIVAPEALGYVEYS